MSCLETRRFDEGQLLRYLDGELPARQAGKVRRHMETCSQCRAAMEEVKRTVSRAAQYRLRLGAAMPVPPAAWPDLTREFERIDAETARASFAARLWRALAPPSIRWSAAAAAALALIAFILYQWRETPSVQAATLLQKAVAAANSRPPRARRVRIRTRTAELTRVVGEGPSDSGSPAVEALFRSANYAWDDPLSAKAFQTWRAAQTEKRDEVTETEDAQSYRIHTTTGGELAAATLTLRRADLEPTAGRFEFRNQEWVEMTELTDLTAPPASAVAEATGGIPSRTEMPPRPGAAPPVPPAPPAPGRGIAEELQVFAALRQVGADLGDPLEIERAGGRVLVSGAGISQQRQQQIHGVLDALPNVSVRFSEASAAVPIQPPPESAAGPAPRPAPGLLQQKLGGTAQFERFRSTLLDQNDAAMARAFALRRLAEEFPPDAERELTAANRGVLRDLAREHVAVLAEESGSIGATVSPLLGSSAASAAAGPRAEPGPWQPAAEEVLRAAHEMETSLAALLGAAPAENAADLPARFAAAMGSLRTSLERCRVLLSYDDVGQR